MNEPLLDAQMTAPRGRILKGTLIAAVVAAAALVLVVLPAEYGVDPTGFGRLTGLTQLAATSAETPVVQGAPPEVHKPHAEPYRTERMEITLEPYTDIEIKAHLPAGETMVYSWKVNGDPVYFDFHGEPTEGDFPEGFAQSYQEAEGAAGHGTFVAPFTGRHGWYWLSQQDTPLTVELQVSGYFSRLERISTTPVEVPPEVGQQQ